MLGRNIGAPQLRGIRTSHPPGVIDINERTTRSTVTFRAAFKLPEFEESQLAGTYDIDTIEQGIPGNERTVYIRTATLFYLRGIGQTSVVTVDPRSLLEALEADARNCL